MCMKQESCSQVNIRYMIETKKINDDISVLFIFHCIVKMNRLSDIINQYTRTNTYAVNIYSIMSINS